jgi:UDP-glucose 4-epimerase
MGGDGRKIVLVSLRIKMNYFKDKILLITGGTGSFGNSVLDRFLQSDLSEIRIFSRDEKKQDDMRKKYNSSKLKFFIGDVRDIDSVNNAMTNVDYVFHAAALKQVPSCEFYPIEAVKTNILGTENILNSAIQNNVTKVICLSTDKAVYPVNAMGMSKGLMEKVLIAKARTSKTIICGTRYGNVIASRGSVIPLFMEQIRKDEAISITDPQMTRFLMSLDEAVDLVIHAFENGENGDVFVQKSPASSIENLAKSIRIILKKENHPIKVIGTRHGEKLYETLLTREEISNSTETERYYKIRPDKRDLNYSSYFEEGEEKINVLDEYHSHNTEQLDVSDLVSYLSNVKEVQSLL